MAGGCTMRCKEWKEKRPGFRKNIYGTPWRWCRNCRKFISQKRMKDKRCLCCGYLVRNKARRIYKKRIY